MWAFIYAYSPNSTYDKQRVFLPSLKICYPKTYQPERNDLMTVNELLNTNITLNPIIKSVAVGNTNEFAISNIQTKTNKGKPYDWNVLIDIAVPKDSTLLS